ncbi:MAG: hypothetical protein V3V75_08255 [Thermoguttaceae bacterium]|jgi:hypothetical protein
MAILSGKNGTLYISSSEITPVSNWRLRITSDNPNYAANDTGGWKQRAAGVRDSSGSFDVKVDSGGNCPVEEGDSITLKLHVDDTGNNYYEVPALIDRIEVEVDINEGRIVAYGLDFSGNGAVVANGILAKS